jgi:hypothetical protein
VGGVDDICRDAAFGDAAGVGAVGVVELEVLGQVGSQAAVGDVEVAGEAWAPAFVKDRLVEVFEVAVGLGAACSDAGVACVELAEGGVEAGAKLVAVIGEHAFELPATAGQVGGDPARELAGLGCDRLAGGAGDEVGPSVGGVAVDGGDLPDRVLGASQPA